MDVLLDVGVRERAEIQGGCTSLMNWKRVVEKTYSSIVNFFKSSQMEGGGEGARIVSIGCNEAKPVALSTSLAFSLWITRDMRERLEL